MQRVEYALGEPLDVALHHRHHVRGMTLEQIGAELGVTKGTVSRWMVTLGVEARLPGQRAEAAA